jgi:hypothetical protein
MSLSLASNKMLNFIQYQTECSKDYVIIDTDKCINISKMSYVTVRKSIAELIDKGFIIKRRDIKQAYWINPRYFFCGSRVNKYPQCVNVVKTIITGHNNESKHSNRGN